jgi:FlaG/FlaF family flagellin (archaellin)
VTSIRARIEAIAAVILLQANMALAVEPSASVPAPTPEAQTAPARISFDQLLRPSWNPIDAYRG